MEMQPAGRSGGEHNEPMDEARRLRRLQVMMSMVMSVIGQDPDLTLEEAAESPLTPAAPLSACSPIKSWPMTFSTAPAFSA